MTQNSTDNNNAQYTPDLDHTQVRPPLTTADVNTGTPASQPYQYPYGENVTPSANAQGYYPPDYDSAENSPYEDDEDASIPQTQYQAEPDVANAARNVGSIFTQGFHAIRDVRNASRQTEDVKKQIAGMQQALDEDQTELTHREEIEQNYDRISYEQSSIIAQARAQVDEAHKKGDATNAQRAELVAAFTQMKANHEEQLSPYRALMESTKARSDEISRSLAEERRITSSTESQARAETKTRDQRIASATREVDTTRERLQRIQGDLSREQSKNNPSANVIKKLQQQVIAEQAFLDTARDNVSIVTQDAQRNVDNAKSRLLSQQQSLQAIERQATAAKQEANVRKEEYDSLYKTLMAQENDLNRQISDCDKALKATNDDAAKSEQRAKEAQALLEEANQIHATPEATNALRNRIAKSQADITAQTAEADRLEAIENELRDSTRKARVFFIGICVLVIALVALIVWLVVTKVWLQ